MVGNVPFKVHDKTSVLLNTLAANLNDDKVKVGFLLYKLRRRSFGGILFFLAIVSLIPGISFFAGLAMILIGGQMLLGLRFPSLPRVLNQTSISVEVLKKVLQESAKKIEAIEQLTRPRFLVFNNDVFIRIVGCCIMVLAGLIIIPLPFTNLLPALTIILFSVAIAEKDGLLIVAGLFSSIASFWLGFIVIQLTISSIS
ncbi:hypothetical protein D210916BOD24_15250 [Alteromonas sp. D210916BOD_24]|uniref:exopolysaccharide biosynthesis protein n=1 Tax=Alteromonas sp. D210916BOD_24 TaxID=3157618 RepID=UPI00399CFFE3